jgi:hypothetical protein
MKRFRAKRAAFTPRARKALLLTIFVAFAIGLPSASAFAQGCAMCYATARATPKDGQRAINRGIIVMLLPPIGAMTLGVGAALRYGRKRDREIGTRAD